MRLKRYNEMFVDEEGNIWDDENKTKKSFEYEDKLEVVATIDEGDPDEGSSFEIKFWEMNRSSTVDNVYFDGVPYVLTDRDFNEFISDSDLARLPSYDIHSDQTGILTVYGEYTYEQMKKMLSAFGIKVVKRDY